MYGLNPGTKVAQYTLEQQLGQGGQGSVWRARAAQADGQMGPPVALKVIPVRGAPVTMVERVKREAEALQRLSVGHPSVVQCVGVSEDPTLGVLAVAMELVEGVDLQAILKDPRCDGPAREAILLHVARALGYLHTSGVVHRDVKPQNILVKHRFFEAQADPSMVKLVDFGIATPTGNPKPLTEVGTVIGTPAYMPPERIDPMFWQAAKGLPCEDVFALGVVAYETLFGRHPAGVEDDGTLSVYAERYRAVSRSGEVWPQLPPGHRWTSALNGALALKRAERLVDGNAVAERVTAAGARTMSDPGLQATPGGPRTEIGTPIPVLAGDMGIAPPGQTYPGGVPPVAGGSWPSPAPAYGAGPGALPVPPAPSYAAPRKAGGGSALRTVLAGVGLLAIGIPAVILIARWKGEDTDNSVVTVPTATETAAPPSTTTAVAGPPTTPGPIFTSIPTTPTTTPGTYKPAGTTTGTGTSKPPSTGTGTGTAKPPSTGTGSPTGTGTGTGTGKPPHIGGGAGGSPGGTSTTPGGRPPITIKIGVPGGTSTGSPGGTSTGSPGGTGLPGGGRPPIKIGRPLPRQRPASSRVHLQVPRATVQVP